MLRALFSLLIISLTALDWHLYRCTSCTHSIS